MSYFRITLDNDGYRARFYSGGRLVWWTEGYTQRSGAVNAIASIRAHAATAPLK